MEKVREAILIIIEDLRNGNIEKAYQLLSHVIPTLGIMIDQLGKDKQLEWSNSLGQVIMAMQQQDSALLAEYMEQYILSGINEIILLVENTENATEFAEQYQNIQTDGSIIFVYGLGNGAYIRELENIIKDKKSLMVVYEPIESVPSSCYQRLQVEDFFEKHDNCILFADGIVAKEKMGIYPLKQFEQLLSQIIHYSNRTKLYQAVLPGYCLVCEENYRSYCEMLQFRLTQIEMTANNNECYGKMAIRNARHILDHLPTSCSIYSMKNLFHKKIPAVVVSAGPSLEKNAKLLKKVKNKALIVCVDSAISYLLELNILPDVIVTIDPRKPVELFNSNEIKGIPMIIATDANANIIEKVCPEKLIVAQSQDPYIRHIFENVGKPIENIETGGSVSIFAVNICEYIGIRNVIMIGQDLAFSQKRMYAGKGELNINENNYIEVEGIDGEKVYTTPDYNHYRIWYEKYIRQHRADFLVNATEGGALIKGCPTMDFDRAIDLYMGDEYDIKAALRLIPNAFETDEQDLLRKQIFAKEQIFENLLKSFEQGKRLAEKGIRLSMQGSGNHLNQYNKINLQMNEILEKCDRCDEMYQVRWGVETQRKDMNLLVDVYSENKYGNTVREQYQKMKDFFDCMLKSAQMLKGLYEEER